MNKPAFLLPCLGLVFAVGSLRAGEARPAFDPKPLLAPEAPTVFVFRATADPAGEALLTRAREEARKDGKTVVRAVEAAGTPEVRVYDRHGRLVGTGGAWEEAAPHLAKALRTPRIKWIDTDDPEAEKVYGGKGAMVADIGKTMSLRPELLKGIMRVANQAHFSKGFLDVQTKEMIASYVSALNECRY